MKRLSCLVPALLLSGCLQGSGSFPSLAPRGYEVAPEAVAQLPVDAPAAPPAAPLSYEQREVLAAALDRHRAAEAAFRAALPAVRAVVGAAAGSVPGSEAWVVAQQALSRLEVARTGSVAALADLDRLMTERLAQEQQGAASGGAGAIAEARAAIADAVADQSAIIAVLSGRIG